MSIAHVFVVSQTVYCCWQSLIAADMAPLDVLVASIAVPSAAACMCDVFFPPFIRLPHMCVIVLTLC